MADDHWVDDSFKKNSPFSQKMGDVRSRNTQVRMQAAQAAMGTDMPTKMTATQMRLAALPPEYHAAEARAAQQLTQRQYVEPQQPAARVKPQPPGFGAYQPAPPPEYRTHDFTQPPYSQQNSQPDYGQPYSQQYSQPNYAQPNSQQYSQPNYAQPNSQQSTQPTYGQTQMGQLNYGQQAHDLPGQPMQYSNQGFPNSNSQQYSQPNYVHPADSQQYSQPSYANPASSQQYSQPNYSQQMRQPDYGSDIGFPIPPMPAARELTDEEIDERALYDSQTRAYNLRHIVRMLRHEYTRATFNGSPLSIFVIAIDNFATIPPGAVEKAVDAVSRALLTNGRPIDLVGRYTEGRFMLVSPEMNAQQAAEAAEIIRKLCENIAVSHQWQNLKMTASIGVATTAAGIDDVESLIALADLGSDMVVEQGGNGVFVAPADSLQ